MPSSWEILEMQKQRVLLSVIVPPDHRVTMAYSRSLHGAIAHLPPGSVPNQVAGLPYDAARNQAAKIALDQGMHLAFLDSDMRLQNDQAFRIMLDSGLELVTGLYHQRFPPYAPAFFDIGKNEKGELTKIEVKGWKPGDIVPAIFIPTGLWLCRHETLKRMFQLHPRPFRWGVDIAPVPDYNGGTVNSASEDYNFSLLAKQGLGIQPYVMTGVVGFHEVTAVVGPRWAVPYPDNDQLHGVVGVM